jgi:Fe2+ or Zn2+ uptake regulation protein
MDGSDMVKSERKELILKFMAEHPLAMSPVALYRNLRIYRELRVGKETVKNYLKEMAEEGLVLRIDKSALDDAEIQEADADDRAYYIISEDGKSAVESDFEDIW